MQFRAAATCHYCESPCARTESAGRATTNPYDATSDIIAATGLPAPDLHRIASLPCTRLPSGLRGKTSFARGSRGIRSLNPRPVGTTADSNSVRAPFNFRDWRQKYTYSCAYVKDENETSRARQRYISHAFYQANVLEKVCGGGVKLRPYFFVFNFFAFLGKIKSKN